MQAPRAAAGGAVTPEGRPRAGTKIRPVEDPSTPLLTADVMRRALLSGVGIAFITLAFIASYAGALHNPKPHGIQLAVTAQVPQEVQAPLERSAALSVRHVAGPLQARQQIDRREAYGAITFSRQGFTVITAPAASTGIALLLQATLPAQLRATGQRVQSVTVHPLPESDSRGLVGFYTIVGWAIAGYLGATLFGITFGTRIGHRKTMLRLGALVITGLLVGLGGTLVANAIGGMSAPWLSMTLLGALVITTTGAITVALQSLLGVAGTGIAILLFVILGNPSSGGPAAPELMPAFWRDIGQHIPVGAGVTAFRNVAYFPAAPLSDPLLTLFGWLALGVIVALIAGRRASEMTQGEADVSVVAAMAP